MDKYARAHLRSSLPAPSTTFGGTLRGTLSRVREALTGGKPLVAPATPSRAKLPQSTASSPTGTPTKVTSPLTPEEMLPTSGTALARVVSYSKVWRRFRAPGAREPRVLALTCIAGVRTARPCQTPITETLHKELDKEEDRKLATHTFQTILKYLGDYPTKRSDHNLVSSTPPRLRAIVSARPPVALIVMRWHPRDRPAVPVILERGLSFPQIWRDEIIMQVLKQTINNRNANSLRRAWQLLGVVLSFLPPSPPFRRVLQAYLAASMNSKVRGVTRRLVASAK